MELARCVDGRLKSAEHQCEDELESSMEAPDGICKDAGVVGDSRSDERMRICSSKARSAPKKIAASRFIFHCIECGPNALTRIFRPSFNQVEFILQVFGCDDSVHPIDRQRGRR